MGVVSVGITSPYVVEEQARDVPDLFDEERVVWLRIPSKDDDDLLALGDDVLIGIRLDTGGMALP